MCNLRCVCIVLGAFLVGVYAFISFNVTKFGVLNRVIIVVILVGALVLLVGAILEHERLMLLAFIANLIVITPYLIILLAVICNFGGIRDSFPKSESVNSIVTGIVVRLVVHLIVTCVVYAYYKQLQDSEDE